MRFLRFFRKNDTYRKIYIYGVTLRTGDQNYTLGVVFDFTNSDSNEIEVIELNYPNTEPWEIFTTNEEVLNQVILGLKLVNKSLGTPYKVSKILYCPTDGLTDRIYSDLIALLIRHYHSDGEFEGL